MRCKVIGKCFVFKESNKVCICDKDIYGNLEKIIYILQEFRLRYVLKKVRIGELALIEKTCVKKL